MHRYLILILLTIGLLASCSKPPPPPPSLLQQIKAEGVLQIATYNGPTTIYQGPQGQTGFEHDLVQLFARQLGLRADYQMTENSGQSMELVRQGKAHLAAAGIVVTPFRQKQVRFGPSYQTIDQHLVYRHGKDRAAPKDFADLIDTKLEFSADSVLEERLDAIKRHHPELSWISRQNAGVEEMVNRVDRNLIDFSIAPSNHFALIRRYQPHLRAGLKLLEGRKLAWAFAKGKDDSLLIEAQHFFARIKGNGKLQQLIERYYGHTDHLNFVDLLVFKRHYRERLPEFVRAIKYAAFVTDLDWRMLAAVAYQESHWDPKAISPTGVRGLMMLTRGTAKDLGVKDRTDPQQSIIGGAQYLKQLIEKLPERIGEPDRTWFALAGYNVGFGHLQDARFLALLEQKNADKWSVIKEYLPRLTERKWYSQTTHGYARGKEPVHYVDNIRSYYDLLLRFEENKRGQNNEG